MEDIEFGTQLLHHLVMKGGIEGLGWPVGLDEYGHSFRSGGYSADENFKVQEAGGHTAGYGALFDELLGIRPASGGEPVDGPRYADEVVPAHVQYFEELVKWQPVRFSDPGLQEAHEVLIEHNPAYKQLFDKVAPAGFPPKAPPVYVSLGAPNLPDDAKGKTRVIQLDPARVKTESDRVNLMILRLAEMAVGKDGSDSDVRLIHHAVMSTGVKQRIWPASQDTFKESFKLSSETEQKNRLEALLNAQPGPAASGTEGIAVHVVEMAESVQSSHAWMMNNPEYKQLAESVAVDLIQECFDKVSVAMYDNPRPAAADSRAMMLSLLCDAASSPGFQALEHALQSNAISPDQFARQKALLTHQVASDHHRIAQYGLRNCGWDKSLDTRGGNLEALLK